MTVSVETGASAHWPVGDPTCRSIVTDSESERNARDRMKTLTRSRSPGLPDGEYQFVTSSPVIGSSEAKPAKPSASRAASHNTGLTVLPVCGPKLRSDSRLARPSTVNNVSSVRCGSSIAACGCSVTPAAGR